LEDKVRLNPNDNNAQTALQSEVNGINTGHDAAYRKSVYAEVTKADKESGHVPRIELTGGKLDVSSHAEGRSMVMADGSKVTEWDNGVMKVERSDHTGFMRDPDGMGGYTEQHWGPKEKDNFDVASRLGGDTAGSTNTCIITDSKGKTYFAYPKGLGQYELEGATNLGGT
jgi:hypothetical protein